MTYLPLRKYMRTYPRDSRSSLLLCSVQRTRRSQYRITKRAHNQGNLDQIKMQQTFLTNTQMSVDACIPSSPCQILVLPKEKKKELCMLMLRILISSEIKLEGEHCIPQKWPSRRKLVQ